MRARSASNAIAEIRSVVAAVAASQGALEEALGQLLARVEAVLRRASGGRNGGEGLGPYVLGRVTLDFKVLENGQKLPVFVVTGKNA